MVEPKFKRLKLFLGWTFGLSWTLALIFYLSGAQWGQGLSTVLVGALYMAIPALCAIGIQKRFGQPLKESLRLSLRFNRWFLVAWLLPVAIILLATGLSILLPGVSFSPGMEGWAARFPDQPLPDLPIHLYWLTLIQGLVAGVTINAVFALGEEVGWRGLLLTELSHVGFWRASLIIGTVWGIWHGPLILQGHNYPNYPVLGIFMMILFCILMTPPLILVTQKAQSVVAAAIFHGTINALGALPLLVIAGGNELGVGLTGLAGMGGLALINLGIVLYRRGTRYRTIINH